MEILGYVIVGTVVVYILSGIGVVVIGEEK